LGKRYGALSRIGAHETHDVTRPCFYRPHLGTAFHLDNFDYSRVFHGVSISDAQDAS
jgi:hypothetical protein